MNMCFCWLHLKFPFSQKNSQVSPDDLQRDQAGEPKENSKKDRKGRKNKKKRDRGSKGQGKGKRKGKGKKGSRKKKHEEDSLHEEGFLSVPTTVPEPQGSFQPTEVPDTEKTLGTTTASEALDLMEVPTLKPDSTNEASTVVPDPLPETEFSEEVVYQ